MKRNILALLFAAFLTGPAAYATESPPTKPPFHPPQTAAEQALDKIWRLNVKQDLASRFFNNFDEVLPGGSPKYNPSLAKKYSHLFTEDLQRAWADAEDHGVDKKGYPIEMDIISCKEFSPYIVGWPVYRTVRSDASMAIIEQSYDKEDLKQFSGQDDPKDTPALFKMTKNQGRWKMDGINCGGRFNMPPDVPSPTKN